MKCPICESKAILVLNNINGYMKGFYYDIYECSVCKISFSNPLKTEDFIYESIYKNPKKIAGYDRYYKYTEKIKNKKRPLEYLANSESIYWSVKNLLSSYKKENRDMKILEIGSGLGYLTYAINQSGFNCLGIDISSNAIGKAKNFFGDYYKVVNIFDENFKEKFDLVVMTEVVEHVENPVQFIARIKEILNGGGKLLITTPNKFFESEKTIWVSDVPPVHLFSFTEKTFELIGEKINMGVSFVDFTDFNKKKKILIKKNFDREYHISFLKNLDRARFKDDGSYRPLIIKDYFIYVLNRMIPYKLKIIIKSLFCKNLIKYKGGNNPTLGVIFTKI